MEQHMSNHWFLTGASSGIGRHLAELILAAGDDLTATARKPESLDDLAAKYPSQLRVEALDVTVKDDIAAVVARAQARRPVDILVNNAGGGVIGATEEMSDAEVEGQIALNLMAPIHITRAFVPAMRCAGAAGSSRSPAPAVRARFRRAVSIMRPNGAWRASANASARSLNPSTCS
jgi:short-subunit dehydrogenase